MPNLDLTTLQLTDDLVILEEIQPDATSPLVLLNREGELKKARVLAVGPGAVDPLGQRLEMPCRVGDTVYTNPAAGGKKKIEGVEYWFVNAHQRDIVAVVPQP